LSIALMRDLIDCIRIGQADANPRLRNGGDQQTRIGQVEKRRRVFYDDFAGCRFSGKYALRVPNNPPPHPPPPRMICVFKRASGEKCFFFFEFPLLPHQVAETQLESPPGVSQFSGSNMERPLSIVSLAIQPFTTSDGVCRYSWIDSHFTRPLQGPARLWSTRDVQRHFAEEVRACVERFSKRRNRLLRANSVAFHDPRLRVNRDGHSRQGRPAMRTSPQAHQDAALRSTTPHAPDSLNRRSDFESHTYFSPSAIRVSVSCLIVAKAKTPPN